MGLGRVKQLAQGHTEEQDRLVPYVGSDGTPKLASLATAS